ILITLVGQGLLLSPVLKFLQIKEPENDMSEEKQEMLLMRKLKEIALEKLKSDYAEQIERNSLIRHQKHKLENELMMMIDKVQCMETSKNLTDVITENKEILRQIIQSQRNEIHRVKRDKTFDDHVLRSIEMQLDFEEAKITGFRMD